MNKILTVLTALFFICMIFLTFFSRTIHESSLPHVDTYEIKKQNFTLSVQGPDGEEYTTVRREFGIPREYMYKEIYIVIEKQLYGEMRCFAHKVHIQILEECHSNDYIAVSFGLSIHDQMIIDSDSMYDGCEIIVN